MALDPIPSPRRVVAEATYDDGVRYRVTIDRDDPRRPIRQNARVEVALTVLGQDAELRRAADHRISRDISGVRFTAETDGEIQVQRLEPEPAVPAHPAVAVEPIEDLHFGVMPTLTIDFGDGYGKIATTPSFEGPVRALVHDAARLRELRRLLDGGVSAGANREEVTNWVRGIDRGTWDPTPATKQVLASILRLLLLATEDPEL